MAKQVLTRFGGEEFLTATNIEQNTTTNGLSSTDVQGALNETVALAKNVKLTSVTGGYDFTKADNTVTEVRYNLIDGTTNNPKLTITVGGTLVKTIPLNQNQISIANGTDWDLTDDELIIKDTAGTTVATINFSKYNISAATQTNGSINISQNGNIITTIPAPRQFLENSFIATAGQTSFTLTETPTSALRMYRNGVRVASDALTSLLKVCTYVPANNGASALVAGDRIQITYIF